MNFKRTGSIFAIAAVGTMLLASCASNEGGSGTASEGSSDLSGTIAGIGASSQQSAQEAWTAGYQTINEGVTVNYDPQGSGGGRESFIAGAADFAASDRAFTTDEISSSTFAAARPTPASSSCPPTSRPSPWSSTSTASTS